MGRSASVVVEKPQFREAKSQGSWPPDAFRWRPTAEVASDLARCCSRRVVSVSNSAFRHLLVAGEISAKEIGVDDSWDAGAVIVSLSGAKIPLTQVCLFHDGCVRR